MTNIWLFIFLILTLSIAGALPAQNRNIAGGTKELLVQQLANSQTRIDSTFYSVRMRFKEFGSDSFVEKNFIVSYRSNPTNQLYGYDYLIAEVDGRDTFISMALNQSFYMILSEARKISAGKLPEEINLSNYFENIRSNYVLQDVCQPFLNSLPEQLSVVDSQNTYYFHLQVNELATRHLEFDKKRRLPKMWSSVIVNRDFDLAQILEIHFGFDEGEISPSYIGFDIEKYLNNGYEYIESKTGSASNVIVAPGIVREQQEVLLNHPFLLATGDTVRIREYKAKFVLLDFWFASCLPCLRAFPELNSLSETYSRDSLQILGINCFDQGIKESLAKKMNEKSIQIPFLFGSDAVIRSLGISSFPSYYLIDTDGNIELITGGIEGVKRVIEEALPQK